VILEYLARAQLVTTDVETALATIDAAIRLGDTPARRQIRGQILEADNRDAAALREYQWALTLSELVPYDDRDALEERIEALIS